EPRSGACERAMTRDGTVGRFRRNRAKPGVSSGHQSRLNDEDSVRGPHQSQQSTRTAPTGRTHDCKRPLRCTPNDLLPGGGHPHMNLRRSYCISVVNSAVVAFLCANAAAQEGYYGVGHEKWHQGFYSQLRRNDGGSCCNLMDCRPTQSRIVGDHYEVKVDGVWTPVPYDKINNVVAPAGGAHVC